MTRYRMRLRRPAFRGIAVPFVRREHVAFRLVLVGLLAGILVAPVWWLTTQTWSGQWIGDLALYSRASADPAALDLASQTLGLVSLASALAGAAGVALVAIPRGGLPLTLAVMGSIGGANLTTQALKRLLDRPDLLGQLAYATGNSFPSGHVTLMASIGFAVILVAPRVVRTPAAILASVAAAAIGVSAMSLAWHRLADVIGAILIALAWTSLATALLVLRRGWMPRRTWGQGRPGLIVGAAAVAGIGALGAGLVILAAGFVTSDILGRTVEAAANGPTAFVAATVAALGSSLVGYAAFVWAMNGVALEST
jgi:membrane-associated phospholipid phosphatase